jgi:hypothetical protein
MTGIRLDKGCVFFLRGAVIFLFLMLILSSSGLFSLVSSTKANAQLSQGGAAPVANDQTGQSNNFPLYNTTNSDFTIQYPADSTVQVGGQGGEEEGNNVTFILSNGDTFHVFEADTENNDVNNSYISKLFYPDAQNVTLGQGNLGGIQQGMSGVVNYENSTVRMLTEWTNLCSTAIIINVAMDKTTDQDSTNTVRTMLNSFAVKDTPPGSELTCGGSAAPPHGVRPYTPLSSAHW